MQSVLLTSNAGTLRRSKCASDCMFPRHGKLKDEVNQK